MEVAGASMLLYRVHQLQCSGYVLRGPQGAWAKSYPVNKGDTKAPGTKAIQG